MDRVNDPDLQDDVSDLRRIVADLYQRLEACLAERDEAFAQQAATTEVLQVINASPGDLTPVFEAMLERAMRLCDGAFGGLFIPDGDTVRIVAARNVPGPYSEFVTREPMLVEHMLGRNFQDRPFLHIADLSGTEAYRNRLPVTVASVELGGVRTFLGVPLLKDGSLMGVIGLYRQEARPFSDKQIELARAFAAQAVIAMENARLLKETRELLARQTATSEILRVISQSPTDVRPVFEAIVLTAVRLLRCDLSFVILCDPPAFWVAAAATPEGLFDDLTLIKEPIDPSANFPSRAILEKRALYLPDWSLIDLPEHERHIHETVGVNSALYLPLLREGECIGLLTLGGKQANIFGESEIALAESFRDQALIAIENVRLFNETKEALEQQKASADILSVISNSVADTQPVFDKILRSIEHLFGGQMRFIFLAGEDGLLHIGAVHGPSAERARALFPVPLEGTASEVAIRERRLVSYADVFNDPDVPSGLRETAHRFGENYSMVVAPMLWEDRAIGSILVGRTSMQAFSAKECGLLRTFADQAVIAIQNARLFEQVQAKTHDLSEALIYQTGSGNILRVIASSPTDVGPVLKAVVDSACELCDAYDAAVVLRDGDDLRFSAHHGPIPIGLEKWPINRNWTAGRAFLDRKPVHVHDLLSAEGEDFPDGRELARRMGHRSILSVPLLRDGESVGVIVVRRTEVHPFSDKQMALLQTFADQAVIAIGNVRLFDEVQAKTRDLSEALQQQTATADVLKVISRSAFDLDAVLNSLTRSAVELCNSTYGVISLWREGRLEFLAQTGCTPEFAELLRQHPVRPDRKSVTGRTALLRSVVQVPDVTQDAENDYHGGETIGNYRSSMGVPLMRNAELEGVFTLMRREPGPFTQRQVELVQTFADQAVIAIDNARLFEQVQARTRELSLSLDELRTAQDRLVQTEKLASLGQLTAGIAHEIKNPLNFVNNFSALSAELTDELNDALKPVTLSDKIREEVDELTRTLKDNLEKIVQHGKRADSIVKNMLLHSREGSGEHRPADINAILDESLNLAYHGARAEKPGFNVTLRRDFDAGIGEIDVFPQEITRIFLNLISNGFYAVTKRKSETGDPGFEPVLTATTRNLGNSVEIRIRDNGTGIPAEVKAKMFNPFFTTKPAGEGTGLGLSMSHDIIVKQHGGTIDVTTVSGQFTEFTIVLPRTGKLPDKIRGRT